MKFLFLDIDGVLATNKQYEQAIRTERYGNVYPFKKECVEQLNRILVETKCELVISSTWRTLYTKDLLSEIFKQNGVNCGHISRYTIDMDKNKEISAYGNMAVQRVDEINDYLAVVDCEAWCAVDDMPMKGLDNFVKTQEWEGLIKSKADEIIKILNK